MMTLASQADFVDPMVVAHAAYLRGDLAAVQAAFAHVLELMDTLYEGVEMPSSVCSPCYDPPSFTEDLTICPTMLAAYSMDRR